MMRVYFDASVLVSLIVQDGFTDRADALLEDGQVTPCISDFAAAEVSGVLGRQLRTGRLTLEQAREALAVLDVLRSRDVEAIETDHADVAMADGFLRRLDLTLRTPDSLHLALAARSGASLATFDLGMANCARTLGVALANV
jgi:predicted nucleic acid-binding protein